jgi:hypothetical protein
VNVEHLGLDPENTRALLHFGLPAPRERTTGHGEMADVAVGHRHELHLVAPGRPLGRDAAGLQLSIIRVRTEGDDPQHRCLRLQGIAHYL